MTYYLIYGFYSDGKLEGIRKVMQYNMALTIYELMPKLFTPQLE